jgi:tetratricopeptide (TPR) repeat protein
MKKQTMLVSAFVFFSFLSMAVQIQAASIVQDYVRDYKNGLSLYQQGRYEQALVRFEQAIDENFTFWQSYQMVGYCYFELHEKDDAMKAFEESLKINPNNPKLVKIYNNLKSGNLDVPVRPIDNDSTVMAKIF